MAAGIFKDGLLVLDGPLHTERAWAASMHTRKPNQKVMLRHCLGVVGLFDISEWVVQHDKLPSFRDHVWVTIHGLHAN
jgi:hypothetical protein